MARSFLRGLFVFVVVVQFSGIPVMVHYCGTTQQASISDCAMCAVPAPEEESSCCADEPESDYPVAYTSERECCHENLLAVPLQTDVEKPLSSENNKPQHTAVTTITMHFGASVAAAQTASFSFCDSSPPGQKPPLTILHSSLLI